MHTINFEVSTPPHHTTSNKYTTYNVNIAQHSDQICSAGDWRVIKINKWNRECLDMAWRHSDTRQTNSHVQIFSRLGAAVMQDVTNLSSYFDSHCAYEMCLSTEY